MSTRMRLLLSILILFLLSAALLVDAKMGDIGAIKLPKSLEEVKLPHKFTAVEMEAIRARLRAFSLELAMFQVALPMMDDMEKQRNYASAAWPVMQCLIKNQDDVLKEDPEKNVKVFKVVKMAWY